MSLDNDDENEDIRELKRALKATGQSYINDQAHLYELWCGESGLGTKNI